MPAIRRDRREAMLLGWLEALPDDVVRTSPVLSVFYGYLLMVSGDLGAFSPRLDDAERALAAAPAGSDPRWASAELRTLPATIAVYRASLAQARGDLAGTAEGAAGARSHWRAPTTISRAAGRPVSSACASGRRATSRAHWSRFTQAVASLHASDNLVDELSSTVVLADMWLAAGHPGTARGLYQRALQVSRAHGGPVLRATPDLHVGLSELDYEVGDLAAAKEHLQSAAALGEGAAMAEGRYRWFGDGTDSRRRGRPAGGRRTPGHGGAALPARVLPRPAPHRRDAGAPVDHPGQAVAGRRLGS